MPDLQSCERCSNAIPGDAPSGLCPACLLLLGLDNTPVGEETPLSQAAGLAQDDSTGELVSPTSASTAEVRAAGSDSFRAANAETPGFDGARTERPERLGNLDVIEEIGHGGMGVVYRAHQRIPQRDVAVKILSSRQAARSGALLRFAGEIEALAGIDHPNIVKVYEGGEESGCLYFSMELVTGGSLARCLEQGPLDPGRAAEIVQQLAEAVETAHRAGVLHRDIKPGNVLLDDAGHPKLSDFGLAKWMDREDGLTETGAVLGTASYMAPEQALGSKQGTLGPQTDVYALGATLYELLTGRPPFREASTYETLQKVIGEPPVPPRALNRRLHRDLEAVCLRCLEKDAARRYATAAELAEDLGRWRRGEPTIARPLSRPRRAWHFARRHARWIAAAAVLLAVAIAVALQAPPPEQTIMRKLQRGEAVELIGESGAPKYYRWVVGTGNTNFPQEGEQFLVYCAGEGLLELVPDCQSDHYRLTVEYRQDGSNDASSAAGLYFAHQPNAFGTGMVAHRAVIVAYSDNMITNVPRFSDKLVPNVFDFVTVNDTLIYPLAVAGFDSTSHPLGNLRIEEPKPRVRPTRKITVTVSPAEIQMDWHDPDKHVRRHNRQGPEPRLVIPADRLKSPGWAAMNEIPGRRPGDNPGAVVPYQPRGGLGLYLRDARVVFFNVRLEPLTRSSDL